MSTLCLTPIMAVFRGRAALLSIAVASGEGVWRVAPHKSTNTTLYYPQKKIFSSKITSINGEGGGGYG